MKQFSAGLGIILLLITNVHANEILYFWSGGITATSGKVNAVLKCPAEKVRLIVIGSTSDQLYQETIYSSYATATVANGNTVALEISGLQPNTVYKYSFEIDGTADKKEDHQGSFQTFSEGAFSFKFVAGSCNFFPNNRVYDIMRNQDPLFLLMPGDLHYANPSSSDVDPHRTAYEEKVLQQPREAKFLQSIPIAYVWDDHDFCGDNNDGSTGCGLAAYTAYKEYVPYYPFGAPEGSNAIYQSFKVGRVRFIMTDLRSERKMGDIMSVQQKNWFKNEVLQAKNNNELICWVSSVSFSGSGGDNWGAYPEARKELANFFRDSNIVNMFIISGDAHMLAIDNGTHSDFSDNKNNSNYYPILQSAALNNVGSDKGGEYSEGGTFPNPPFSSQWSTVEVSDYGGAEICVKFTCYRMDLFTKKIKVMTSYQFCRTLLADYTPVLPDNLSKPLRVIPDGDGYKLGLSLDYVGKGNVRLLDDKGKVLYNQPDAMINNSFMLDATNLVARGIMYYIIIETEKGNFISNLDLRN